MNEIWKSIDCAYGYDVSNYGRIRNRKTGSIRKCCIKKGYLEIRVQCNNKTRSFAVHRLVATSFVPNPNNYPMVNHKDCDKLNNNADNLEWCTNDMNMAHAVANRRCFSPTEKLSYFDALFIKTHYIGGVNGNARILSELFNVSMSNVCNIHAGRSWVHL